LPYTVNPQFEVLDFLKVEPRLGEMAAEEGRL
jgi:hypothetical protein